MFTGNHSWTNRVLTAGDKSYTNAGKRSITPTILTLFGCNDKHDNSGLAVMTDDICKMQKDIQAHICRRAMLGCTGMKAVLHNRV